MDKILVTGGAGFIGSHVVCELLERGYDVVVLDDLSSGRLENLPKASKRLKVVIASILDVERARESLVGCSSIIHLAAIASVQASIASPQETHRINFDGVLILLNLAKKLNIKRFIFSSSAAVYGNSIKGPAIETQYLMPITPYAIDKLASEYYLEYYRSTCGLLTTSFRFFNVYGPRQNPSSSYSGVISIFSSNLINGKSITIYGDGSQTRDFIFVGDLAKILANSVHQEKFFGKIINVGTGNSVALRDVALHLGRILEQPLKINYQKSRSGDIKHSSANVDLLRSIMGNGSMTHIEQGLRLTLQEISHG